MKPITPFSLIGNLYFQNDNFAEKVFHSCPFFSLSTERRFCHYNRNMPEKKATSFNKHDFIDSYQHSKFHLLETILIWFDFFDAGCKMRSNNAHVLLCRS